MFHTLLHLHLDTALVLTDVECHLAQPTGNKLAKDDSHRRQQQQGPSQTGVKPLHEQECAAELYHGNQHLGNGVSTDATHLIDILRQS